MTTLPETRPYTNGLVDVPGLPTVVEVLDATSRTGSTRDHPLWAKLCLTWDRIVYGSGLTYTVPTLRQLAYEACARELAEARLAAVPPCCSPDEPHPCVGCID